MGPLQPVLGADGAPELEVQELLKFKMHYGRPYRPLRAGALNRPGRGGRYVGARRGGRDGGGRGAGELGEDAPRGAAAAGMSRRYVLGAVRARIRKGLIQREEISKREGRGVCSVSSSTSSPTSNCTSRREASSYALPRSCRSCSKLPATPAPPPSRAP